MADKYAPKAEDDAKKVHAIHLQLIADQKAENHKAREAKGVSKDAKAQNPQAPVNQPNTPEPKHEAEVRQAKEAEAAKVPAVTEAPGGNESAAGAAPAAQGGPGK